MKQFRTYQLALELNRAAKSVKLKNPHKNQFERAVLSIALNLAEGNAKTSNKDRRRFYETALGSLREVQALIEVQEIKDLTDLADKLGGSLFQLCRSLSH